jgi:hypothetical protein
MATARAMMCESGHVTAAKPPAVAPHQPISSPLRLVRADWQQRELIRPKLRSTQPRPRFTNPIRAAICQPTLILAAALLFSDRSCCNLRVPAAGIWSFQCERAANCLECGGKGGYLKHGTAGGTQVSYAILWYPERGRRCAAPQRQLRSAAHGVHDAHPRKPMFHGASDLVRPRKNRTRFRTR